MKNGAQEASMAQLDPSSLIDHHKIQNVPHWFPSPSLSAPTVMIFIQEAPSNKTISFFCWINQDKITNSLRIDLKSNTS